MIPNKPVFLNCVHSAADFFGELICEVGWGVLVAVGGGAFFKFSTPGIITIRQAIDDLSGLL